MTWCVFSNGNYLTCTWSPTSKIHAIYSINIYGIASMKIDEKIYIITVWIKILPVANIDW